METVSAALLILSMLAMGLWWSPFTDRLANTVVNLPGVTS